MVTGDIGGERCDRVSALARVRRLQIVRKSFLSPIDPGGRRVDAIRSRRRYRGSRRATNSSNSRFIAILTAAAVAAGIAALGVAAALPDQGGGLTLAATAQYDDIAARTATANRASRAGDRTSTLNQPAPELWVLPIHRYSVTSPFGRRWGMLHAGVDLGAPEGTPFYAAAPGVVIVARWNGGYGNNVMIDHGGGIVTVYGHSSKLLVSEGQLVRAGDEIALVGDTGHAFGAHLHFEVRVNGTPVEPVGFMRAHGVDIARHKDSIYP
jgi:murein DD-endopeptidase MepM/ murein hydrolase activator NlpD